MDIFERHLDRLTGETRQETTAQGSTIAGDVAEDLGKMKKSELMAIARAEGIQSPDFRNKDELVAAILASRGGE
jgi:hypothetical protein